MRNAVSLIPLKDRFSGVYVVTRRWADTGVCLSSSDKTARAENPRLLRPIGASSAACRQPSPAILQVLLCHILTLAHWRRFPRNLFSIWNSILFCFLFALVLKEASHRDRFFLSYFFSLVHIPFYFGCSFPKNKDIAKYDRFTPHYWKLHLHVNVYCVRSVCMSSFFFFFLWTQLERSWLPAHPNQQPHRQTRMRSHSQNTPLVIFVFCRIIHLAYFAFHFTNFLVSNDPVKVKVSCKPSSRAMPKFTHQTRCLCCWLRSWRALSFSLCCATAWAMHVLSTGELGFTCKILSFRTLWSRKVLRFSFPVHAYWPQHESPSHCKMLHCQWMPNSQLPARVSQQEPGSTKNTDKLAPH